MVKPLIERGVPDEEAMLLTAPPFPIAGEATYSDDWLFPRMGPPAHLHEGTDIFAAHGTPIVASFAGTVAGVGEARLGGLSLWLESEDGTGYYYTHLSMVADGIQVEAPVVTGTVIGYIGDSGNAAGGAPHLHFEIHPPMRDAKGNVTTAGVERLSDGTGRTRTPAVNPKPFLDSWLDHAEGVAPAQISAQLDRFSRIGRDLHFAGRLDELSGEGERYDSLVWFSGFDPMIGTLALINHSAGYLSSVSNGPGSLEEQRQEAARLAAVRRAVRSPKEKILRLTAAFQS